MDLTRRQQEIFDFIAQRIAGDGMPPTRAEICSHFGFRSPNAAEAHLRTLARKGAIELQSGSARGIRLPLGQSPGTLPVVGRVAAGSPILAQENVEDEVSAEPGLFHPAPDYLLRVEGQSMRDAGILDGDLLAVHRTPEARNGQIVVARIDEEVTVKRFEKKGSRVRLIAENPDYEPILVDLKRQSLFIEGLGVGVIRRTL